MIDRQVVDVNADHGLAQATGDLGDDGRIVKATTFYDDPSVIAEVSRGLGEAMVGINVDDLPVDHRLAERGW